MPTIQCEGRQGLTGLKRVVGGGEEDRGQVIGSAGTHWELRKNVLLCMQQIQNFTVLMNFLLTINVFLL